MEKTGSCWGLYLFHKHLYKAYKGKKYKFVNVYFAKPKSEKCLISR